MKKDFNKTAIQQMIEHIENNATKFSMMNTYNMLKVIKPYLKKEKEQIIKAHIDGFDYIVAEFKKQEFAEQYFNYTYNQNDNETNF